MIVMTLSWWMVSLCARVSGHCSPRLCFSDSENGSVIRHNNVEDVSEPGDDEVPSPYIADEQEFRIEPPWHGKCLFDSLLCLADQSYIPAFTSQLNNSPPSVLRPEYRGPAPAAILDLASQQAVLRTRIEALRALRQANLRNLQSVNSLIARHSAFSESKDVEYNV